MGHYVACPVAWSLLRKYATRQTNCIHWTEKLGIHPESDSESYVMLHVLLEAYQCQHADMTSNIVSRFHDAHRHTDLLLPSAHTRHPHHGGKTSPRARRVVEATAVCPAKCGKLEFSTFPSCKHCSLELLECNCTPSSSEQAESTDMCPQCGLELFECNCAPSNSVHADSDSFETSSRRFGELPGHGSVYCKCLLRVSIVSVYYAFAPKY